jgi:hypothetical protein
LIGLVIAAPIAYYAMDKWLNGFAYNVGFTWSVCLCCLGGSNCSFWHGWATIRWRRLHQTQWILWRTNILPIDFPVYFFESWQISLITHVIQNYKVKLPFYASFSLWLYASF